MADAVPDLHSLAPGHCVTLSLPAAPHQLTLNDFCLAPVEYSTQWEIIKRDAARDHAYL